MKQMTAKDLHIAIKRQDGIEYLQKRFSIETEGGLFDVIRRVVPDRSEWFIKELMKNQKKRRTSVTSEPEEVVITTTETLKLETVETTEIQEPETFETEIESDTKQEENVVLLAELLKEEEEMSTSLCLLEGLHKELASKRHSIRTKLESEKAYIVSLLEEAANREKKAVQLHMEYIQCADEMRKLNCDIRVYEELLVEVRNQIEVARRVVVQVYDTGIIELENAEFPEISEDQIKEQFDMLVSLPEAEELTIKSIKSVAKLRVMMHEFPDAEIIFESDAMNALYEA